MPRDRILTDAQLELIAVLAQKGLSRRKIAEHVGCHESSVNIWAPVTAHQHTMTTPELLYIARRLYDRAFITTVAAELGRNQATVANNVRRHPIATGEFARLHRLGVQQNDKVLAAWNANVITVGGVIEHIRTELRTVPAAPGRSSTTS